MLAAASIKVMDALFGFLAQNDAEWTKRELLGRTWRRDWAMRNFQRFSGIPEKIWKIRNPGKKSHNPKIIWNWMLWVPSASNPRFFLGFRVFFPGSEKMSRSEKIVGICATLNLEVLSVPEGLVHSIRLLEAPGVFLARRWRRC